MSTALVDQPVLVIARRDGASRSSDFRACGDLRWRHRGNVIELLHPYSSSDISDDVVVDALTRLVDDGVIAGREAFESAAVALITSVDPDDDLAWRSFYANSVAELRTGTAAFSPVHQRARSLLVGDSVLEVGCCFGFFALQSAADGHTVTATDICAGALDLLDAGAAHLNTRVDTRLGDIRALPFADNGFDTVTVLHLLEHLDPSDVDRAITEACRVARHRVVIAVPYEDEASPHFGHLDTLDETDLRRWALAAPGRTKEIFADHGGWLVIDL